MEAMEPSRRTYLPAAGHDWVLPLYDSVTKLLGIDSARRALVARAVLRPGSACSISAVVPAPSLLSSSDTTRIWTL
jgi:hypothetical protein